MIHLHAAVCNGERSAPAQDVPVFMTNVLRCRRRNSVTLLNAGICDDERAAPERVARSF